MTEKVEEIAELLERLKNETELNAQDFSNILLDIKLKMENMSGDNRDTGVLINDIKKALDSKTFDDANTLLSIVEKLQQLRSLIENTTTTADYAQLSEEVKTVSSNLREAAESVVKFATQDTEAKNVLFEKISALETSVNNKDIVDIVKQKSDELINSYEGFVSNINLQNGNMISALADLREVLDDFSSKNSYLINSFGDKLDENSEKLVSLSDTVSSNLGNVNSKLYSLGDDIQKTLNDGFEHLKYLSSNLSEYMNSNSIDIKTTLECLRANISDYSEQLKSGIEEVNTAVEHKIADSSNIQTVNSQNILSKLGELQSEINKKAENAEIFIEEKSSKIIEFVNAYKDAVTLLKDENNALLAEKFTDFGAAINSASVEYEKSWNEVQKILKDTLSLISETSDSIVLGVVNSNSEIINELKNELLVSSGANLETIVTKIDETNDGLTKFQAMTADNLSEYLSAIKDLFVDFSNNLDSSMRDDEIFEKLLKVEDLIQRSSEERNANFECVKAKLVECREAVQNLNDNIQSQNKEYNENINDLKSFIASISASKSVEHESLVHLENLINEKSLSKDEQLNIIKKLLEENNVVLSDLTNNSQYQKDDINLQFNELKKIISDLNDAQFVFSRLEDLINEKSTEKDLKLESLRNVLADYKSSVDKFVNDSQIFNGNTLSELSDIRAHNQNILPKIDALNNIEDSLSDKLSESKNSLINEISQVNSTLEEIKNNFNDLAGDDNSDVLNKLSVLEYQLTDSSHSVEQSLEAFRSGVDEKLIESRDTLQEEILRVRNSIEEIKHNIKEASENDDNSDVLNKLSVFEYQLTDASHAYEQSLEVLKNELNDYVAGIENIHTETNTKLNASLEAVENVKLNFNVISDKLTTLIGDSGLIEILANIRQQFNIVVEQIHNEKEGQTIELNETLRDTCASISSNLYLIGQNLEEVRLKQSENAEYLRGDFEEKMLGLQADVENIISDIKNIIDEKNNGFLENFEALKESLNGFFSSDFGQIVSDIKGQIEISYVNLLQEFKTSFEENLLFDKVEDSYKESVLKFQALEDFIHETSESNFELIRQTLLNINEKVQSNFSTTESIQDKLEAELVKIESSIEENSISVKNSLVNLLEDLKKFFAEKRQLEMDDFRASVLSLIDNEELLDVIKTLNRSLAEKLEEFKQDHVLSSQDLLDVINSVNNTVDYTLDVINEKFEKSENINSDISKKLDAINSKLDVFAMDDSSEILENISELNVNVSDIKDNTVELKDSISEIIQKVQKNFEYETQLEEINAKLDVLALSDDNSSGDILFDIKNLITEVQTNFDNKIDSIGKNEENKKLEDLIRTVDSKLDILALDDNSEIMEDIQNIKEGLSIVRTRMEESSNIENLIKVIDNKLDIFAQSDNEQDIEDIKNGLLAIENAVKASNFETLLRTIDNKLDIIAQNDNEQELEEIKNGLLSIENVLKTSNVESLITTIDNKIDIIAQNDNSDVIESLEQINEQVEVIQTDTKAINEKLDIIKADTETNSKLEDLINKLHSKVDVLAMDDDGDIQEEISNIKDLIEEQISADNSANVNESLQKLLQKISEIDLSKQASEIKDSVISAVVSVSNEISFVEETEEIKDFVNEKTNDIHRTLMEVKRQLTSLTSSGDDMDFYSYTLQDVESDIAKLRLILKDMSSESSANEICVISNNISKMSKSIESLRDAFDESMLKKQKGEDANDYILSISSRLNQLILTNKEVNDIILYRLKETKDKLEQMDNTAITQGIEKALVSMDEKLSYSANLNTVLKNVMMYLGEWMDGTTETISSIYDKTAKINTVSDAIKELRKSIPDRQDLIDLIETRFNEQESRIDRIERQLDRVAVMISSRHDLDTIDRIEEKLSNLSVNIEKLASYVE